MLNGFNVSKIHLMKPFHLKTDYLLTNTSDSYTNFVSANQHIFQRKWMLLLSLSVHKNKWTNSVSQKICKFVLTKLVNLSDEFVSNQSLNENVSLNEFPKH